MQRIIRFVLSLGIWVMMTGVAACAAEPAGTAPPAAALPASTMAAAAESLPSATPQPARAASATPGGAATSIPVVTTPIPVATTAAPAATAVSTVSSTPLVVTYLAPSQTVTTRSRGDLWPSCWADDDNVYAANGDGTGFGTTSSDSVVNRISGPVNNLQGVALASGNRVGSIWGPNAQDYNRKPTGMACINGTLYLAVQNLHKNTFADAPSASISKSTNHGASWSWDTRGPMFTDGQFTTIFFLDFGKNNANAIDDYVYAYGLTMNWRAQDKLYLGRVRSDEIQVRAAWQFYAGSVAGGPRWAAAFDANSPVLQDGANAIGQGGVVYDKPLDRYIFSSWGGGDVPTFYFYAAPKPWGPWTLIMTKQFANTANDYGGYATTIPSKFISADGKSMWVQSNICQPCKNITLGNYSFALRELRVSQ